MSTGNNAQPQQIFHVSVEYEEPNPKLKNDVQNGRKRRMVKREGIEITQQQLLSQFVQPATSTPKPTPTIIIDDKSQDHEIKNSMSDVEEPFTKNPRVEEAKKLDNFEVFGMFVANEMRTLQNQSQQKKLKRKILECILEMSDQDSDQHS